MWYSGHKTVTISEGAMTFIPTVDTARATLNFSQGTSVGVNVLWFKRSSAIAAADLTTLAIDLTNWWDTYGDPTMCDQGNLNSIDVIQQDTSTSPSVNYAPATPIAGTATGTGAPLNVTIVSSFRTAGRGRSSRGRFYSYALSEADTNNNGITIGSGLQTALSVMWANLAGFVSPDGWTHVVVSKQLDLVARTAGYAQPVTSYIIDTALDSQRRRLLGRGI
jgi:hypothetical protein